MLQKPLVWNAGAFAHLLGLSHGAMSKVVPDPIQPTAGPQGDGRLHLGTALAVVAMQLGPIYLSIYLSVYLSVYLSIYLSLLCELLWFMYYVQIFIDTHMNLHMQIIPTSKCLGCSGDLGNTVRGRPVFASIASSIHHLRSTIFPNDGRQTQIGCAHT